MYCLLSEDGDQSHEIDYITSTLEFTGPLLLSNHRMHQRETTGINDEKED